MRRIGLFGGTFDPPHFGHLALAEWAREQLRLDRVLFVPAGAPPHKRARRLSSVAARVAMTRLAVRGNPAFRLSQLEVRRRGPSFTVDTLRAVRAADPGVEVFLLMGRTAWTISAPGTSRRRSAGSPGSRWRAGRGGVAAPRRAGSRGD